MWKYPNFILIENIKYEPNSQIMQDLSFQARVKFPREHLSFAKTVPIPVPSLSSMSNTKENTIFRCLISDIDINRLR